MKPAQNTCINLACLAALAACAAGPQFPDAEPLAVEECRREAALLAEPDPYRVRNDPIQSEGEGNVIEEARTAAAEAGRAGLAGWPEEVLVYRCLASRGEPLTPEQARELAEWQERLEEQNPR
jgi:hypothetical protein